MPGWPIPWLRRGHGLPAATDLAAGLVVTLACPAQRLLADGTGRLAVLPLTGTIRRPDSVTDLRWLWFPDLGFGLPTGAGSVDWQVTMIRPK